MKEHDDIELLELLATDKKERAFRTLVDRHMTYVIAKCQSVVKDTTLAKDIAQDVFIKVASKHSTFERKASFKTWLNVIAYRESLLFLREKKRLSIQKINVEELKEAYDHIDLDVAVDMDEDVIIDLLDKIDPLDKTLLLMKYKDGMKVRLIAETLALGESNIKMRLKRAKARLLKLKKNSSA